MKKKKRYATNKQRRLKRNLSKPDYLLKRKKKRGWKRRES